MTDQAPQYLATPRPRVHVCLESRYRKLRRGLPQTIFFCPICKGNRVRRRSCEHCGGFGKMTKESVQEIISRRLLPAMQAKAGRFHGAGREDIDVLMLGRGRPFVFEVIGARCPEVDLVALRLDIVARAEGAIELEPFTKVQRHRIAYWKETPFDKVYRAEVAVAQMPVPERLAAAAAFHGEIVQRTPQRVAHRRADLDRTRQLQVLSLTPLREGVVEARILCAHGTYVKEWISGDEGRSRPSLGELLGVDCRCSVLDVEEIMTDDVQGPRLPAAKLPPAKPGPVEP